MDPSIFTHSSAVMVCMTVSLSVMSQSINRRILIVLFSDKHFMDRTHASVSCSVSIVLSGKQLVISTRFSRCVVGFGPLFVVNCCTDFGIGVARRTPSHISRRSAFACLMRLADSGTLMVVYLVGGVLRIASLIVSAPTQSAVHASRIPPQSASW